MTTIGKHVHKTNNASQMSKIYIFFFFIDSLHKFSEIVKLDVTSITLVVHNLHVICLLYQISTRQLIDSNVIPSYQLCACNGLFLGSTLLISSLILHLFHTHGCIKVLNLFSEFVKILTHNDDKSHCSYYHPHKYHSSKKFSSIFVKVAI